MKWIVLLLAASGCLKQSDFQGGDDNEVITTMILTFTPGPIVAEFNDADGDGGMPPTIDPVNLPAGNYTLTVGFENRLVMPPEPITEEVRDENFEHLLLFTGSAVVGPATTNTSGPITQSYADMDRNGLPVGLTDNIVATPGTGTMTVTLRHMPPELPPQKSATTLMDAQSNGVDSLGGSSDALVNFPVTVQ